MRRRTVIRGGLAGLGSFFAGCSSRATAGVYTNDLLLTNTLEKPVDVRAEVTGEIDLSLVYPLRPEETATIENYVSEGPYTLTATATIHSDGEEIGIKDTATAKWKPERCHDKRVVVHRDEIEILSAECETTSADADSA